MKKILLSLSVVSFLSITSCKKDDDTAYQPVGNYGNATVTSSNTVILNNWTSDYDDGTNYIYSSTVTWATITQTIKDNGIVMAYIQNGAEWYALPYADDGTTYSDNFDFAVGTGYVRIEDTGFDNSGSPGTASLNGIVVRIVAIGSAGRKANPDLDWKNYSAVKAAFHLKD